GLRLCRSAWPSATSCSSSTFGPKAATNRCTSRARAWRRRKSRSDAYLSFIRTNSLYSRFTQSLPQSARFRFPLPAPRCALGRAGVHLGVIRPFAKHPVHGILQFHRGRDMEPFVRLDEDQITLRPFEAEKQRT